jgi:hypothetical protein
MRRYNDGIARDMELKAFTATELNKFSGNNLFQLWINAQRLLLPKNNLFEVLTAVTMKMAVFWVVAPYRLV